MGGTTDRMESPDGFKFEEDCAIYIVQCELHLQ